MNKLWSQRPARAEGERPTVIGLHTAAGSPEQWRPLAERLRLRYHVLAPDLHGYAAGHASGATPPSPVRQKHGQGRECVGAPPGASASVSRS